MTDFFTLQPGETPAPVPPEPVLCTGSAAMRRIHRVFLWAYDEAPGLVRSAGTGDIARAAYVGEVLGNFDKILHIHHEGEDLLMYPQLAERAPACALHVEQMLEQHRQVARRLETIEPLRMRWMEAVHVQTRLKELMARRGNLVHVLADSSKLGVRPFHASARLALPWTLVTDDGADQGQMQKFRDAGVEVEVAAVGPGAEAVHGERRHGNRRIKASSCISKTK